MNTKIIADAHVIKSTKFTASKILNKAQKFQKPNSQATLHKYSSYRKRSDGAFSCCPGALT